MRFCYATIEGLQIKVELTRIRIQPLRTHLIRIRPSRNTGSDPNFEKPLSPEQKKLDPTPEKQPGLMLT